jgi:CBS domain-containing protein
MSIGQLCKRRVVCTHRNASVKEAAQLMCEFHVGSLVVVEEPGSAVPIGLLTDRDIVREIVAPELDASSISVGDIMNRELITAEADDDVHDIVEMMSERGIRRVPIVDNEGELVGIVSQDDLYQRLSEEMSALAALSPRQQVNELVGDARP